VNVSFSRHCEGFNINEAANGSNSLDSIFATNGAEHLASEWNGNRVSRSQGGE
jgi:hypothetical protein